jgi:hypothetical protein
MSTKDSQDHRLLYAKFTDLIGLFRQYKKEVDIRIDEQQRILTQQQSTINLLMAVVTGQPLQDLTPSEVEMIIEN